MDAGYDFVAGWSVLLLPQASIISPKIQGGAGTSGNTSTRITENGVPDSFRVWQNLLLCPLAVVVTAPDSGSKVFAVGQYMVPTDTETWIIDPGLVIDNPTGEPVTGIIATVDFNDVVSAVAEDMLFRGGDLDTHNFVVVLNNCLLCPAALLVTPPDPDIRAFIPFTRSPDVTV